MHVTVGTFNLNNLFSRWNFQAQIDQTEKAGPALTTEYRFNDPTKYKLRTYKGRLVQGKTETDRTTIAARIKSMNLDVLAAQEVEDIDTLRYFNSKDLGGLYSHLVLIEGNDPRLIDVALMSKLPFAAVTSWQNAVHPSAPGEPVFSRDLLQVEVYNSKRTKVLFTVFNNHLKSHFVDPMGDVAAETKDANERRARQSEVASNIIESRLKKSDPYIVLGDMNDPPNSPYMAPLIDANKPAQHELFDQVWLSPGLASKLTGAHIDRRTKLQGDGSDHDPAWVELNL